MVWSLRSIPRGTILLFPVLLLFSGGCDDNKNQDKQITRSVKTMVVTTATTMGNRNLSGVLKPAEESDLSFQVGGTVDKVEVKLGDTVQKGQVLAVIDPRDYELKKKSAKAELESNKVDVKTTQDHLKRQEHLLTKGVVSQSGVDKARSAYEAAVSKEEISNSRLEEATRNLDRTKLIAPFDGIISLRAIEPHQETQAGRVIFKLQSKEGLKVEVLVPEILVREIKPKQEAIIKFPTLKDLEVPGIVREVSAQGNAGNAFPVTIDLQKTTDNLRAGMSVNVIFKWDKKSDSPSFLIPLTALDLSNNAQSDIKNKKGSVYLFDKKDSVVKRQAVTIGDIQGNLIQVIDGLKEGDQLITAGVPFLQEGQNVTLWQQKYRSPETDQ